jgi:hypothetical protein
VNQQALPAGAARREDITALPAGRTCADCRHIGRCTSLGYSWPDRDRCDFNPTRFYDVVGSFDKPEAHQ